MAVDIHPRALTTSNTFVTHDGKGYDEFAHVPVHRGGARPN